MSYQVQILADSLAPSGARLTTFQLKYPRLIHSEVMTHRTFCLAGDTELEFDLPGGKNRRVYKTRLDQFVDKWLNGADRIGSKPKQDFDISWVEEDREYTSVEIASRLGMHGARSINLLCRNGELPAKRANDGRTWIIRGGAIRAWRQSTPPENRFDIRSRLQNMRIRQFNEDTGDIQWSHVTNAYESGEKRVFEIRAGGYRVAGSIDHLILTLGGWKRVGDLTTGDSVIVRRFGKPDAEKSDPLRLKKIDGRWRSQWQNQQRRRMVQANPLCRRCNVREGSNIHHLIPVYIRPDLAFAEDNITLLCENCHLSAHSTQGWQSPQRLYGASVRIDEIVFRGVEKTYDLEIAGLFPNFLANGVVVHNSRNASSSRAIPVEKMIEWVEADPVIPIHWGGKKKGMQAGEEIAPEKKTIAEHLWLGAFRSVLAFAKGMNALGLHKQVVNRMLEPWSHINVVLTATHFDNFFALRCHRDAQPEIQKLAVMMAREYYFNSTPTPLAEGEWHLPYVHPHEKLDFTIEQQIMMSVARCCRVSYLTMDGKPPEPAKDFALYDQLLRDKHMSPFEHVAKALVSPVWSGNFLGWAQYRKGLPGEAFAKFDPETLKQFDRDYIIT